MKIQPITPVIYKGKINTGMVTLTAMGLVSLIGAHWVNKKTNKEVKR